MFSGGCPAGWFLYNNDCYKLMGDIESCDVQVTGDDHCAADFGTAQLKCVDHKANLVTIHDKYENGETSSTLETSLFSTKSFFFSFLNRSELSSNKQHLDWA